MKIIIRDMLGVYEEVADGNVIFYDGQIHYEVNGAARDVNIENVLCISD